MAEHLNENQYDDDLTVGSDEYDDSYYTDSVDLFEFTTDGDSPISRLKSLVLSIDWEITDEVLMQFNEELIDLRDIWAGEKVNLIYVQALEKISKYIYQRKAEAHPSAIKLLLTLYHNLERIVSSDELSEKEQKAILVEDVQRFEGLKRIIAKEPAQTPETIPEKIEETEETHYPEYASDTDLVRLKAIVLGIDWEITDKDLNDLRMEVVRLEEVFAGSKPKLILLQGIGTIGAYIKLKKSNAHADAFKILHLFYGSLEQVVTEGMGIEEEKEVLFRAVEEFNTFKTLLGPTIAPERIQSEYEGEGTEDLDDEQSGITPAFADIPESDVHGFQADEEAKALGLDSPELVSSHVSQFFPDDFDSSQEKREIDQSEEVVVDTPDEKTFSDEEQVGMPMLDREVALQGVDVETEADDDSDLEALKQVDGEIAPALADADEVESSLLSDTSAGDSFDEFDKQIDETVEDFFPEDDSVLPKLEEGFGDEPEGIEEGQDLISGDEISSKLDEMSFLSDEVSTVDRETALQGVDVDMEGDDDSHEEALPVIDGEIAPALALSDEELNLDVEGELSGAEDGGEDTDIYESVDDFFGETTLTSPEEIVGEQSDLDSLLDNLEEEAQEDSEEQVDKEIQEEALEVSSELVEEIELEDKVLPEEEFDEDEKKLLLNDLEFEEITQQFDDEVVEQEIPDGDLEEEAASADLLTETTAAGLVTAAGAGMLAAKLGQEKSGAEDEDSEEEVIFELVEDDEHTEEPEIVSDEFVVEQTLYEEESPLDRDSLEGSFLQTCIDSLGVEINDTILESLFMEIKGLRGKYADKPHEKTYLQLLSTVVQHVDQFRDEASGEAYSLMQSITGSLEKTDQQDTLANQEQLLSDIAKVLEWQQNMVTRLAGSQTDPVDEIFKDEIKTSTDAREDAPAQEEAGGGKGPQRRTVAAEELKKEIATLRQSLQDEINTLKNELE